MPSAVIPLNTQRVKMCLFGLRRSDSRLRLRPRTLSCRELFSLCRPAMKASVSQSKTLFQSVVVKHEPVRPLCLCLLLWKGSDLVRPELFTARSAGWAGQSHDTFDQKKYRVRVVSDLVHLILSLCCEPEGLRASTQHPRHPNRPHEDCAVCLMVGPVSHMTPPLINSHPTSHSFVWSWLGFWGPPAAAASRLWVPDMMLRPEHRPGNVNNAHNPLLLVMNAL